MIRARVHDDVYLYTLSGTSGPVVLVCKTSCETAVMEAYQLNKNYTLPQEKLKSLTERLQGVSRVWVTS